MASAPVEQVPPSEDYVLDDATHDHQEDSGVPPGNAEEANQSQGNDTGDADEVETVASNSTGTGNITSLDVDTEADGDSALGSSLFSPTTSVRASIYDSIVENGRTYHRFREGKYYLPNDELEQDRLDMQHHLFLLTLDGELYNAPIKDLEGGVHHVLDIATGTGIWAIEFASMFPSANVIGTDLSPIQPHFVPPNCHFEVDDAEDVWSFSHKFDYVHGRALATCFKSHLKVIQSAFDSLRPGGYLELQDCIVPFRCIDDTIKGTALEHWVDLIIRGTAALGKDWTRISKYKHYLEMAGFEDVVERRYEWPVGTWARGERNKVLGLWYREDLLSGLQAVSLAVLTRGLGMTAQEVEVLLVSVREEIKSNMIHVYIPVRVVYGRKPKPV